MRHPFDGLNCSGITRRGALGLAAGAVAGWAGLVGTPAARAGRLRLIEAEHGGVAEAATTEPFGEEAGAVTSRVEPDLEDGRRMGRLVRSDDLTRSFNGGSGPELVLVTPTSLALQGSALKNAWRDLGSKDAALGVQGCALLYGAKDGVAFLKANLTPEALTVPDADRRSVAKWIDDLDASAFKVRDGAEKELEKVGAAAVTAMKRALGKPRSLEQRKRLERLIEQAEDSSPATRGQRALEVLVALRTPEAKELLAALANGAEKEWLTGAAKEALERAATAIPKITTNR